LLGRNPGRTHRLGSIRLPGQNHRGDQIHHYGQIGRPNRRYRLIRWLVLSLTTYQRRQHRESKCRSAQSRMPCPKKIRQRRPC
jgi:hypothetical protein